MSFLVLNAFPSLLVPTRPTFSWQGLLLLSFAFGLAVFSYLSLALRFFSQQSSLNKTEWIWRKHTYARTHTIQIKSDNAQTTAERPGLHLVLRWGKACSVSFCCCHFLCKKITWRFLNFYLTLRYVHTFITLVNCLWHVNALVKQSMWNYEQPQDPWQWSILLRTNALVNNVVYNIHFQLCVRCTAYIQTLKYLTVILNFPIWDM